MIYYDIFDLEKLMLIRYVDEITEIDLLEFIPFAVKKAKENLVELVLDDLRMAIFNFDLNALGNIIKIRFESGKYYSNFKEILLIDTIRTTTYSALFTEKLKHPSTNQKICSTIDYAIRYLDLSIDEQTVEDRIKNLKFEFNPSKDE